MKVSICLTLCNYRCLFSQKKRLLTEHKAASLPDDRCRTVNLLVGFGSAISELLVHLAHVLKDELEDFLEARDVVLHREDRV